MSKPLLNVEQVSQEVNYRSSKSDEVCRNLLYFFAGKIGPGTLELVQTLHQNGISESENKVLDDIITLEVYTDQEIEKAADVTLQASENQFDRFRSVLFWGK